MQEIKINDIKQTINIVAEKKPISFKNRTAINIAYIPIIQEITSFDTWEKSSQKILVNLPNIKIMRSPIFLGIITTKGNAKIPFTNSGSDTKWIKTPKINMYKNILNLWINKSWKTFIR